MVVIEIQRRLLKLPLSIINHTKILCLQFPFFTTFYLSNNWFPQNAGLLYIYSQIVLTGSFIYFSFWLYKNNIPENLNKKWCRNILAGAGEKPDEKAIGF